VVVFQELKAEMPDDHPLSLNSTSKWHTFFKVMSYDTAYDTLTPCTARGTRPYQLQVAGSLPLLVLAW
jgi:hypothetical protein